MLYQSSPIKLFTYTGSARFGGYYGNGSRFGFTGEFGYRFQPIVSMSVALDYNDIRDVQVPIVQSDNTIKNTIAQAQFWIIRPKIDFTFTNKLFFTTFFKLINKPKTLT